MGRESRKSCKSQGIKELRNILISIVKSPTQAKCVRFKIHLQKCKKKKKKKIQVPPGALCRQCQRPVNYHVCAQLLSCIWLFATPWTIACQAPLSMGFSKQGYWGGLPFPTPGDFPNPGIKPTSPALAGGCFYHWGTRHPIIYYFLLKAKEQLEKEGETII